MRCQSHPSVPSRAPRVSRCHQWAALLFLLAWAPGRGLEIEELSSSHKGGRTDWIACRVQDAPEHWNHALMGCPTESGIPGVVPGTVLETLLENGTFQLDGPDPTDPYYERNLEMIPDVHDVGRGFYTFWFVAKVPLEVDNEQMSFWLQFKGINYRASAYADGHLLGHMAAAFTEHWFEVPRPCAERGSVMLAVMVEPVDFVGLAKEGQGGDHLIAKNAAVPQFVAGWDWIQGTPDRNTGLWDAVLLRRAAHVRIRHPLVQTRSITFKDGTRIAAPEGGFTNLSVQALVSEETSSSAAAVAAELVFGAVIQNVADEALHLLLSVEVQAAVSGRVLGKLEKSVLLEAHQLVEISNLLMEVSPSHQEIALWWPHTHGLPNLHTVTFAISRKGDDVVLAKQNMKFGIRVLDAIRDPAGSGGLAFRCNGRRVFLAGGNWIASDQLFRFANNATRYEDEVRLHREMGMNILRVWGGGLAERDGFYAATDKLGMLVMQEFWMTGDNNGRWAGNYSWPADHKLYLRAVNDTILRLRNSASLLFFCGGNELYPKNQSPSQDIAVGIRSAIADLNPLRFYITSSMAPQDSKPSLWDPSYALAMQDGPYGFLFLSRFWQHQPGLDVSYQQDDVQIPFQPEVGSSSQLTLRSLQRMLSNESMQHFPPKGGMTPPSLTGTKESSWIYHKYLPFTTPNGNSTYDHVYAYGDIKSVEDYCFAAQLAQRQQYQALFEGFQAGMWSIRTAVLMWKSQSPWPALRGSLYDYYLAPTGGYYGTRKALQEPVHVQLRWQPVLHQRDPTWGADIVCRLPNQVLDLVVHAKWINLQGVTVAEKKLEVPEVAANAVTQVAGPLDWPQAVGLDTTDVLLLALELQAATADGEAEVYSRNAYWLANKDPAAPDYSSLQSLRAEPVVVSTALTRASQISERAGEGGSMADSFLVVKLALRSDAKHVAFGMHLELVCNRGAGAAEDRILPAWFSDGYFFLLPGEQLNITLSLTREPECQAGQLGVRVEGWNSRASFTPIPWMKPHDQLIVA